VDRRRSDRDGEAAVGTAAGDAPTALRGPSWIPNTVTFLRAALVPLILVLLAVGDELTAARWWAFLVFVFAALTDTVDGWVARRLRGVSAFGAFADPVADKLLIVGTLAALALFGEVPWWVFTVITGREALVTLLRVVVVRRSGVVVPATVWGKLKTVTQIVAVAAVILPITGGVLVDGLVALAVALTIGSGLDYLWRTRTLVGRAALDVRMGTS
jgi:CDP-diacylglycerol---glycerol-3-phosphate 3-phosphatidyltransferase